MVDGKLSVGKGCFAMHRGIAPRFKQQGPFFHHHVVDDDGDDDDDDDHYDSHCDYL